ncbi:MAG: DUF4293 domain-containing protein [Prevotella sp.]|nr:DUF4293 domain-containing protein [Prevotella sp.]
MIQRKQTIYLILAVIASVCCLCLPLATLEPAGMGVSSQVFNLWVVDGNGNHVLQTWPLFVVLLLSASLAFVSIFMYKKRRQQAAVCTFNIFLLVLWYLLFGYFTYIKQDPTASTFSLDFPAGLPAVNIILNFMARMGIIADEKLVRSMDRIR